MTIYERYCEIRDSKGYKDSTVAEKAKIGRSTFSDWKSGRSEPKKEKLEKIARALGISYEYLLTGIDPDYQNSIDIVSDILESRRIWNLYNDLTDDGKKKVHEYIELLYPVYRKEKNTSTMEVS